MYFFIIFIKNKIGNGGSGSNFGAVINTLTLARSLDYRRL
jgi:cellobiose-specific phosphotransferase system component IIC